MMNAMDYILGESVWMTFNICLALIAVSAGWGMYKAKNTILRLICGFFWLIFLPNTIYLITDLVHIPTHVPQTQGVFSVILVFFFLILFLLGIITYIAALYPFERLITQRRKKPTHHAFFLILLINIAIGFGVILGRVERTNSWEILTNLSKVRQDTYHFFLSEANIIAAIVFGLLCNMLYFFARPFVKKEIEEMKQL